MDFASLLKQPLPSAVNTTINENTIPEDNSTDPSTILEHCGEPGCTESNTTDTEGLLNRIPETPEAPVTPQEPETPPVDNQLTPEESQNVDDMMNVVATPFLISAEMNEDEIKEFTESVDANVLEAEGFLTERTVIRFDKKARKAQLYEVAIAAVAREKKDPLYRKLETVYKMERMIKQKLHKKYHAQAQIKVKEYLNRAKKSKSSILSRIASKLTGK